MHAAPKAASHPPRAPARPRGAPRRMHMCAHLDEADDATVDVVEGVEEQQALGLAAAAPRGPDAPADYKERSMHMCTCMPAPRRAQCAASETTTTLAVSEERRCHTGAHMHMHLHLPVSPPACMHHPAHSMMASRMEARPMPVLALARSTAAGSTSKADAICCVVASGSALGRSILLSTGTRSKPCGAAGQRRSGTATQLQPYSSTPEPKRGLHTCKVVPPNSWTLAPAARGRSIGLQASRVWGSCTHTGSSPAQKQGRSWPQSVPGCPERHPPAGSRLGMRPWSATPRS